METRLIMIFLSKTSILANECFLWNISIKFCQQGGLYLCRGRVLYGRDGIYLCKQLYQNKEHQHEAVH